MNLTRHATWGWVIAAVVMGATAIDDAFASHYVMAFIGCSLALFAAFQAGRVAVMPDVILHSSSHQAFDTDEG